MIYCSCKVSCKILRRPNG